jgi:hypothetical protein
MIAVTVAKFLVDGKLIYRVIHGPEMPVDQQLISVRDKMGTKNHAPDAIGYVILTDSLPKFAKNIPSDEQVKAQNAEPKQAGGKAKSANAPADK